MKGWDIRSEKDLQALWLNVGDVPRRTEGRTHKQYERYYVVLYLLALADHGLLTYPLTVEEGESPDFILRWECGETIGLEITRATDKELQRWIARAEKEHPEGSVMTASLCGYAEDQLEKQWCELVRNTIEAKVPKLGSFKPASRYDLLVPDDTRMGPGDRQKVFAELAPWANELRRRTPNMGKVSVAVSLDILYDFGGERRNLVGTTAAGLG
jgi:hypothetical protein